VEYTTCSPNPSSIQSASELLSMSIFNEQIARKPDLYSWTQEYVRSMHDGFWTHREFNFQSDIQDFKVNLSVKEREMVVRALSTIGQLEIAVKKFWAKLGDNLPHPSIIDMGYVMANTEVIHGDAYERLLEVLGIEDSFEEILKLDIISGRVNYLKKYLHKLHSDNKKQFVYSLILFTLFIENIALFSQFYVISWFGRFKNQLKDTNKQVEYTSREECYIHGTEVLTPSGWRMLHEMLVGDDICQYNSDGSIEFTKVLHKVDREYSGDIISFERGGNKCSVTPNHDMVFYDQHNQYRKKQAKDLKLHKNVKIPKHGKLSNNGINELSLEDRLKIAIQADGSTLMWTKSTGEEALRGADGGQTHSMSFTKNRKKERIEWILNGLNIEYFKSDPDPENKVTYRFRFNHDYNYKQFDWIDLSDKTEKWCQEFIEEIINWDGYKAETSIGYCSTNKKCLDIVQTIAILAGKRTSFYANIKTGYEDTPCYKLCITESDHHPISHGIKKVTSHYEGSVHCVTVDSGAIITRLDGKTFIAGNCLHSMIGMKLVNVIRSEHPELFDKELEEKILHEAEDAIKYELKIINWILDGYNDEYLNSEILEQFIKSRMNDSLREIGYREIFEIDKTVLSKTVWFDEQVLGNNMTDFFNSRPVEYSKNSQSFNEDDLFN